MPIVSSSLVTATAQKDGRAWITETHTDQVDVKYVINYLAAVGLNTNAVMTARASQLSSDITAQEIAKNIAAVLISGSLAAPTFVYSTAAQNQTALRVAYLSATQVQAIMIGDFLSTLTDVQLQNAFGLTAGQVTTLRTNKLTPAANLAASIRAATGQ